MSACFPVCFRKILQLPLKKCCEWFAVSVEQTSHVRKKRVAVQERSYHTQRFAVVTGKDATIRELHPKKMAMMMMKMRWTELMMLTFKIFRIFQWLCDALCYLIRLFWNKFVYLIDTFLIFISLTGKIFKKYEVKISLNSRVSLNILLEFHLYLEKFSF